MDVEPLGNMGVDQNSSVLERNAEIEDVTVRVKEVTRRSDDFGAFKGHELADFDVHPAFGQDRKMEVNVGFDEIRLHDLVHGVVELSEEVGEASVRSKHSLELKAPIK